MASHEDSGYRRLRRAFTLGSGPLRRGSDRIQVFGRVVVVLSFFLAPLLAVAVVDSTTTRLEAVAATEAAERTLTTAVLLEDAPRPPRSAGDFGDSSLPTVTARAMWSGPGGTTREGLVRVEPRTPVGTAVPVWVDREGNLAHAPLDRTDIAGTGAAMGAAVLVAVPVAAWGLYVLLCLVLDRARSRRWEHDWAAVAPEWKSRLL
ncbi:MAG TPA: hypothetical protein VFG97_04880 [Pedococcus sp.]|nr:hypothetical protein [Pedococcus sp.]